MISTTPAVLCSRVPLLMRETAVSGIHSLPDHGELHRELGALAGAAVHANLARMFLDDAVGHSQSEAGASGVALPRRFLGGEKGIVNALNVFGSNAAAGVA